MTRFIKDFVAGCVVCQQVKLSPTKPLDMLQPPMTPIAIWEEISLDFITGLSVVKGQSVIIVVVDRLSKYCHLGRLSANYLVTTVAHYFVKQIVRLHGIPKRMVSDCDKIFLSKFWQEIFIKSRTTLNMSTTYHPQTDGQTKIVNKTIEGYLRMTIHDNPRSWVELLPCAELWYNTAFHHSADTSSFKLIYGRSPPILTPYLSGDSRVETVDKELTRREKIIAYLREHLRSAQDRMKRNADIHRTQFEFREKD